MSCPYARRAADVPGYAGSQSIHINRCQRHKETT
ncbi:hypothetical protein MNJPNG_25685 [Cupriavidus oxalaticus]